MCLLQLPFLLLFAGGQDFHISSAYFLQGGASVILNVIAGYFFIRSLQMSPLSKTIPFLSFTPVFTAVSGYFFLGETLPLAGMVGILLVVFGALFLGWEKDDSNAFTFEKGSALMIFVSLIWSITPVLDKQAVLASSTYLHTLILAAGIAISFGLIAAYQEKKIWAFPKDVAKEWRLFLIAGALNLIAVYSQFESFQYLPISYVEALKRAIGISLAFLIGVFFFSEKISYKSVIAGALMIFGSAFIIFSK